MIDEIEEILHSPEMAALEREALWGPDPAFREVAFRYLQEQHARLRELDRTVELTRLIDGLVTRIREALDGDA